MYLQHTVVHWNYSVSLLSCVQSMEHLFTVAGIEKEIHHSDHSDHSDHPDHLAYFFKYIHPLYVGQKSGMFPFLYGKTNGMFP